MAPAGPLPARGRRAPGSSRARAICLLPFLGPSSRLRPDTGGRTLVRSRDTMATARDRAVTCCGPNTLPVAVPGYPARTALAVSGPGAYRRRVAHPPRAASALPHQAGRISAPRVEVLMPRRIHALAIQASRPLLVAFALFASACATDTGPVAPSADEASLARAGQQGPDLSAATAAQERHANRLLAQGGVEGPGGPLPSDGRPGVGD